MKKISRPDFRRETQSIIENSKMTDSQIARTLSITARTADRWRRGISNPHPFQFERLKQFASGQLASIQSHAPPDTLTRIMGHIDQLTKQIAHLQGQVAVLQDHHERRFLDGEKKISELGKAVRVQAEQLADRVPRPKKA